MTGSKYLELNSNLDYGEYDVVQAVELTITSKHTGKSSKKRCYQGYDVVNDVQMDLDGITTQFATMFDRIDI